MAQRKAAAQKGPAPMITCNLTKPETTIDNIRKAYPKLKPTDAAMVSAALVLSGRYAVATYDEKEYNWPEDYENLSNALVAEISQIQSTVDTGSKKALKAAAEEEAIEIKVEVAPSISAGELVLGGREDLKTLLSDLVHAGVEYIYASNDIGWQWALDRVNWSTITGADILRRVKLKVGFSGETRGTEMGTAKKRVSKPRTKAPAQAEETESDED